LAFPVLRPGSVVICSEVIWPPAVRSHCPLQWN